jgi:PAS domain S-box-containing protein
VLAVLAIRRWRMRRDRAAGWLALAFLAIAALVTVGRLVPKDPDGILGYLAQRANIELLVLFPYLLYRFATEFVPPSRRLQIGIGSLTVGLTIFTFALPTIPKSGEAYSPLFTVYVVAFFVHWTLLTIVVTRRLWRSGRALPSVAANRMRMLAFAAAALTVALLGTVFTPNQNSVGALLVQALGFVAIVAFVLGVEPPQIVRGYWRMPEQHRLQEAMRDLVTLATSRPEIAGRIAAPSAALVGARGLAVYGADDELLATYGTTGGGDGIRIEQPGATFVAWTSPYAPFFGDDELRALQTVAALTATALDRVRLFEQEHEARLALERANEVMTNFVALAAHELRTPVTTVHGFVQTLNHLGDRLDPTQREELSRALEQQTKRMAALVEQLLDLSRLDADAVDVRPQALDVRARLAEVVAVAAGRAGARRRRRRDPRPHRQQPRDERPALRPLAGPRGRAGRERPAARRGRGLRPRCRRRARVDALRPVHARRCRARPRLRDRARSGDRAGLCRRASRRPAVRALRAERRPFRRRAAVSVGSFFTMDAEAQDLLHRALLGEAIDLLEGVAVFVWNEERHYVAVNEHACRLVGLTRAELIGMPVGELSPDRARDDLERTRQSPVTSGSSSFTRRDGEVVELEWTTVRTRVAGLAYMVSICRRVN